MARRMMSVPPVLGGYNYIRPLGTGGFADVFLYEQDMPRRVTAVKVLASDAINPEVLRTFNVEADIMARLSSHPSIVTIYEASISADGRPYFAMEYCPDTMSVRYKKGALSVSSALDTGVRIAGALETAHRAGLLHRDIKPSNILVTSLGSPVLADFGIAAGIASDEEEPEAFALSVPWSSPEVLYGQVTGTVASEVWSFAATIYTLLAGRSPFELEDRTKNTRDQITRRIGRASYTRLPRTDVPPRIDEVLARAMSKDPARRHSSVAEVADELRAIQYELGIAPTVLEVADPEWAGAAPVDFADDTLRGPVISTVKQDSRRAARARRQLVDGAVDRDGLPVAAPRRGGNLRAGVLGAVIGAGVLVVAAAVLLAIGVL